MEVCNNLNFWVSFKDNEKIEFMFQVVIYF